MGLNEVEKEEKEVTRRLLRTILRYSGLKFSPSRRLITLKSASTPSSALCGT